MKTYQHFEWSEPETLSEEYRQMIIQRMQKQHGFGGTVLIVFLLLLASPFLLMLKNDVSHGGLLVFLIIAVVLAFSVTSLAVNVGEKRVKKLQANNFVWRYGTVTRMQRGGRYRTAKSEVDGQTVPYIFGASEGDTVIVIGFDTAQYSKTLATFYATAIK